MSIDWANDPQHLVKFSRAELRQLYHGLEFTKKSVENAMREPDIQHMFPHLKATHENVLKLMDKVLNYSDEAEQREAKA
jgi:glycyl-tRNA synthetase beta subunit